MNQWLVTYRLKEDVELYREVLRVSCVADVFHVLEEQFDIKADAIDAIKIEPLSKPNLV